MGYPPVSLLGMLSYVPDSQVCDINDGKRLIYREETVLLHITRFTVGGAFLLPLLLFSPVCAPFGHYLGDYIGVWARRNSSKQGE